MAVIVIFRCGEQRCALDRAAVGEVAPIPELSRPPGMPANIEGFLNLGGEAVPVVAACALFGFAPGDVDPIYRHVLILEGEDTLGLLVDRAEDVRAINAADVTPAPAGQSLNGCVSGQLEIDGEQVHLLESGRILLAAEKARLAALRSAEQARLDALGAP